MTAQGNRPSSASPSRQRIPNAGGRLNRPFGVRPYLEPRATPPVVSFESEPPSTPGVETASATRSAAIIGAAFILSRLLGILQRDGRISNQDLAEAAAMSTSACWRRVKALEDAGVIRRYAAIVDPAACGLRFHAIVHVQLARHEER